MTPLPPRPRAAPALRPRAASALRLGPLAVLAALSGCASLAPDGGFAPVQALLRPQLAQEAHWARDDAERAALDQRAAELLAQPLDADAAVQLALLRHRGLQAALHELGIADAERVQASRLPNPGLSLARLRRGDELEWETGLHLGLGGLVTLPWRRAAAQRRLERVQAEAAQAVLVHAAQVRRAWVRAVAAQQSLGYARQVADAAGAGAELARRLKAAGNFNALQQLREQAFEADAALGLVAAQRQQVATRERLLRLLGLADEAAALRLPDRLPELPAALPDQPEPDTGALARRLDVQAARLAVAQAAQEAGVDAAAVFTDALELGAQRNRSNQAPTQRGWELGLELPLFDLGDARRARAQARLRQAVERAAQVAIDARSELREAQAGQRAAWALARRQRDELLPLRERIAEENLLRYNGMLIGVFELLADARGQIAGVNAAIEAQRDFWLADADLQMALVGATALEAAPAASLGPAAPAAAAH